VHSIKIKSKAFSFGTFLKITNKWLKNMNNFKREEQHCAGHDLSFCKRPVPGSRSNSGSNKVVNLHPILIP
jgi:hypothetical protein